MIDYSTKYLTAILCFLAIWSCRSETYKDSIKQQQYEVQGRQIYARHCSNCHNADGTGLAALIPPLKGADYLEKMDLDDLVCQIKFGLRDTIMVNGVMYHQPMPASPSLTALEIAEIITFVDNAWGGERGLYSVKMAERAIETCR